MRAVGGDLPDRDLPEFARKSYPTLAPLKANIRGMKKLFLLTLLLAFSASALAAPVHHHHHHHHHHAA
jgi:hypothetical protein